MANHKTVSILVLLCMGMVCLVPARAGALQNVVFVLIDALRADRVDATRNGVPVMPYLNGLPGVHFRNAVTPAAWTLPAMASLFTSQYVDTHGVFAAGASLPPSVQSMAAYFKEAGYTTIGIQTNGNLTAQKGFAQGFDQYGDLTANDGAPAATVTAQAVAATQSVGEPFFLYAHYMEPHLPCIPPQSYRTLLGYPDPMLPSAEKAVVEDFMPYFTDHLNYVMGLQPAPGFPVLSAVGKESVRALYDGEARYADDQVGILLDDILGRFPNTIVVVLSDHGDHFWEHNFLSHVVSVYEPLAHVPLIIRAPGLAPENVDDLVDTVGLLPTLAGLLGLSAKPAWQGRSLFASRPPQGPAFSCTKSIAYSLDIESARLGAMKVICNRRTGAVELYNIASDPGEAVNLAQQQPALLKQMTTLLNVHLRQNARQNGADGPLSASPAGPVEEDMPLRLSAPAGLNHVWFKNGQPIDDNPPHLTGATTPSLFINTLVVADSGEYECMYSDNTLNLRITGPFTANVLAADSVPVFGVGMAAVLMVLFAGLGCVLLRGRGGETPKIQQ